MSKLLINPSREYVIHNPLWIVRLNTGDEIYQNIHEKQNSWLYLKRFLDENRNKYIHEMYLRFRNHYEHIGKDQPFFFFTHKLLCHHGVKSTRQSFYVGGCGDLDGLICKHFRVPELILSETDHRDIYSAQCRRGIIAHPKYRDLFKEYYDEQKI